MLLGDAALDTPVAQADMTVDGTARKHTSRLDGRNVGAGSHQVFIGTVGGCEDGPISGNLARGFGRANENLGRGQLVAHAKDIRRLGVVFIQRPRTDREAKLLEIVDARDRQGPFTSLFHRLGLCGREARDSGRRKALTKDFVFEAQLL